MLLPALGAQTSLVVLSGLYVVAGAVLAASVYGARPAMRFAVAGGVLFAAAAVTVPDIYASVVARRYARERMVFRAEGVQTTAAVHLQPTGRKVLYLDGLHQANDSSDMVRIHAEIGQLPMAIHAAPKTALVVGVGGGVTAGAVAAHDGTALEVVELAQSVLSAVPHFAHVNGDLLNRPNVRIRVDDARNFLRFTPGRYDVITADLIQPIHAGAGNLYSVEYFALARAALADDGVMMQWIGHREDQHYKLIMRTFLQVFPHTTLWAGGTLMVGRVQPLRLDRAAFEPRLASPTVRAAFATVGLDSFDALLGRFTAGPDEMRRFAGDGQVLTDDRPLLEFHRSLTGSGAPVDVSSLRGDVHRYLR